MCKRLLWSWLLCLSALAAGGQPMPLPAEGQPTSFYGQANTAGQEAYLNEAEKSVILLLNMARLDGPQFASRFLILHEDSTSTPFLVLKARLLAQDPLPALRPAYGLYKSAAIQAREMGNNDRLGTTSMGGLAMMDRIHQQLPGASAYASDYQAGTADPLELVIALLEADVMAKPGTSRALLANTVDLIGVALRPHRTSCANVVLDMARQPAPTTFSERRRRRPKQEAYFMDCPKGSKTEVLRGKRGRGGLLGRIF